MKTKYKKKQSSRSWNINYWKKAIKYKESSYGANNRGLTLNQACALGNDCLIAQISSDVSLYGTDVVLDVLSQTILNNEELYFFSPHLVHWAHLRGGVLVAMPNESRKGYQLCARPEVVYKTTLVVFCKQINKNTLSKRYYLELIRWIEQDVNTYVTMRQHIKKIQGG